MKKKRRLIILGMIITIGVLTILGFKFYNNQYYAQRLINAIGKDDITQVETLLKSSTGNVDSKRFAFDFFARLAETNNATPLFEACSTGNLQMVKKLIDAGADVNTTEPITKGTPLSSSLSNINKDRIEIANLLIDSGANVKDEISCIFWTSCINVNGTKNTQKESDEYSLFLRMVDSGVDLQERWKEGNSILHASASQDNLLVVKYLVEKQNVNVDTTNNAGRTPLMCCKQLDTAIYLLEHGANKSIKDSAGKTAYDYAVDRGNTELAKLLKT